MATIIYPQLDGVKINKDLSLPIALIQAIRKAYDYIGQVTGSVSGSTAVIEDLRANRTMLFPATSYALGSLYYETDTTLTYINKLVNSANAWVYLSGVYRRTQSQLSALAATLTVNDNLLRVNVTDYAHMLAWANPAWGWAPEDPQNAGQICFFDVAPGTGWALLDGVSPITILRSNGATRSNANAAALNANVYLRAAAAYNGAVTPATVPTFAGSALATHAHDAPITDNAGAYLTELAVNGLGGSYSTSGCFRATATSTPLTTLQALKTSATSAGTPAGTVALPGDPIAHTDALPYIRK